MDPHQRRFDPRGSSSNPTPTEARPASLRLRAAGALLSVSLLAGCVGDLTRADDPRLEIRPPDGRDEATLHVGDDVRLEATFSRASAEGPVVWLSERPAVATVDPDGRVTAVAEGSARIVAASGALSDTLVATVLRAVPKDGYCAETDGGLRLQRGEAYRTTARSAARLCLRGGDRNEIYIAVPFHAARDGGVASVEVSAEGIGDGSISLMPEGEPPVLDARPSPTALPDTRLPRSTEFDRRLRLKERLELAPLVVGPPPPVAGPTFAEEVGATVTLNVNGLATCDDPDNRRTRVAAVGTHAVILHDTSNPAGGFTDAEYREFARIFDELVYPTISESFGPPTDIDGNGRVRILFTQAVNAMTERGAETVVAGFFFSRDLFPRADSGGLRGCGGSNQGELLYMMTPDPEGTVNGNGRSRDFVESRTAAVLAHELQHLINASRRLRALGLRNWSEDFWLNEGLSHVAEELVFYRAAGLAPRSDVGARAVHSSGREVSDALYRYQSANLSRYGDYLRNPAGESIFGDESLSTRGASWSFLRYAADRLGDEAGLWRALTDSDAVGYANVRGAIGESPLSWMHDWIASFYLDDFIPVADELRQPSWNGRSILPTLSAGQTSYPLRIDHLRIDRSTRYDGGLVAGGGAILRFSIPEGGAARLTTTAGGLTPPDDIRLMIVRTW